MFFPLGQLLRNNRAWFNVSLIIFLAGFLIFFINYQTQDDQPFLPRVTDQSMEALIELIELIQGVHPIIAALIIFINNVISSFQMLFLGVFLGISPVITLFLNGGLLGWISAAIQQEGVSLAALLVVGILPHGIPELFAFFICSSLGIKLGFHTIISPLPGKHRIESFKYIWKEIITVLPLVVLLLFLAAFIETFITPGLLAFFSVIP